MIFIETSVFTRQIKSLINDDEYKELQEFLLKTPNKGKIISGSSGIRKLRWRLDLRGKRGGFRLIYYWYVSEDVILMLLAYPKNVQDNLTDNQLDKLKKIVKSEFQDKVKKK